MKKVIIIIALFLLASKGTGQQEVMVSQYMFNGLFINPAYAGSHEYISSSLLHRTQWVNFSGAPTTALLAVDGAIPNRNVGLGLIVAHDRIGVTEQTDIHGNYAYQLRLGEGKLAFGIKAGVSNYTYRNNKLTVWDANDELFTGNNNVWLPKFGGGAYYFTEKFYVGLAVPNLLAYDPERTFGLDINEVSSLRRHYYVNGGYVVVLSKQFKLKPSFLLKYEPTAPVQVDLNMHLLFIDHYWLGCSYRTGDAVSVMAEYQTNNRIRFGYAYDITTSKIRKYSAGTHEIMIGFDFGKAALKIKSPRYF
jgi:type IX secretion system PorP/SprF family membrane protein